jgi:hypothetical protein
MAIAHAHADVEIRVGATHTLKELLDAQTGLFQDVGPVGQATDTPNAFQQIKPIVTYTDVDMAANAIQIGIDPELAATGAVGVTDETLQAKISEATQLLQHDISVTFTVEDGRDMSVTADFKGGEQIDFCTSGFAARQWGTGVYGIITAGHCSRNHDRPITMHGVPLPLVVRAWGPSVDAQFRSIPTGASHRIFDDHLCKQRDPCDVSDDAHRMMMAAAYLCHYGRRTGESCGTVISIFYQPSAVDACQTTCNNSFIRVRGTGLKGCRGDSGGPWYYRGTAYGIHNGGSQADDCTSTGKTGYFSPIRSVEQTLGVDILTDGFVALS